VAGDVAQQQSVVVVVVVERHGPTLSQRPRWARCRPVRAQAEGPGRWGCPAELWGWGRPAVRIPAGPAPGRKDSALGRGGPGVTPGRRSCGPARGEPGALGGQSHRPHRWPRRSADRDRAGAGAGAHRPRGARCGGGPYGDCQAGRPVRSGPARSRRRTTGGWSSAAAGPGPLPYSGVRSPGWTEGRCVRTGAVSPVALPQPVHSAGGQALRRGVRVAVARGGPSVRERPGAQLGQRRRTIGGQVGTATRLLDTEVHRFQ
jgi:hypothetical protein